MAKKTGRREGNLDFMALKGRALIVADRTGHFAPGCAMLLQHTAGSNRQIGASSCLVAWQASHIRFECALFF
jgi:hypothetical protein